MLYLCLLLTLFSFPHLLVRDMGVERQIWGCWGRAVLHLPMGNALLRVPFLLFVFGTPVASAIVTSQLVWSWSRFQQHLFTKAVIKLLGHFNHHKTELQCERPFCNLAKGFSVSGDTFIYENWHSWIMWVYLSSKCIFYIRILQTPHKKKHLTFAVLFYNPPFLRWSGSTGITLIV